LLLSRIIGQSKSLQLEQEPSQPPKKEFELGVAKSEREVPADSEEEHFPDCGGYVQVISPVGILFTEPLPLPLRLTLRAKSADIASLSNSKPQTMKKPQKNANELLIYFSFQLRHKPLATKTEPLSRCANGYEADPRP
jgi:hypothetical protein